LASQQQSTYRKISDILLSLHIFPDHSFAGISFLDESSVHRAGKTPEGFMGGHE